MFVIYILLIVSRRLMLAEIGGVLHFPTASSVPYNQAHKGFVRNDN